MKKDITKVKPIKVGGNALPVKGKELISGLYSNLFMAARTAGGKTTVMAHLLKHCIDERTTVVIFCSTVDVDPTWKTIVDRLKRKKIKVITYDNMELDGQNVVETVLETIILERKETEEEKDEAPKLPMPPVCLFESAKGPEEKKPRQKVYHDSVPQYWFIFDDLNRQQLRSPTIVNLLKKSRHYRARTTVISQSLIHLAPDAFGQLTDLYIWAGFSKDYLRKVHDRIDTHLEFEDFWKLYHLVTSTKYAFLNINLREGTFRKSFGPKSSFD